MARHRRMLARFSAGNSVNDWNEVTLEQDAEGEGVIDQENTPPLNACC